MPDVCWFAGIIRLLIEPDANRFIIQGLLFNSPFIEIRPNFR